MSDPAAHAHPPAAEATAPGEHPIESAGGRRWLALAIICIAQFMLILDVTVANVALPNIGVDLALGTSVGWVIAAYSLPFGLLLVAGGIVADRIGLRLAFLIGLGLFTVASLTAGLAGGGAMLFVSRGVQGVGAALLSPAALGMVLSLFRGAARNRALAVWAAIGGAGSAIGALIGGLLVNSAGWRWIFVINVPTGVIVGILVIAVVRGPLSLERVDVGTTEGRLAATVRALRSRSVGSGSLAMFFASALLIGTFFTLTVLLQDGMHLDPLVTGIAFLPAAVAVALGAQIGAHLLTRVSAAVVGTVSFVVAVVGLSGAWLLSAGGPSAPIVGAAVASLGLGSVFVVATATATSGIASEDSGGAAGVVNTVHEVGGALGVLLLSVPALAVATASGSSVAFGLAAAAAIVAAVVAALLLPRNRVTASGGFAH